MRFFVVKEIQLHREIVMCGGHIEKYGSVSKTFWEAANKIDGNPQIYILLKTPVTKETFGRVAKEFNQQNVRHSTKLGTFEELLCIENHLFSVDGAVWDMKVLEKKKNKRNLLRLRLAVGSLQNHLGMRFFTMVMSRKVEWKWWRDLEVAKPKASMQVLCQVACCWRSAGIKSQTVKSSKTWT